MADVEDGVEVTFDIDASEAFQALAERIVRIERALKGLQTLAETVAVSRTYSRGSNLQTGRS